MKFENYGKRCIIQHEGEVVLPREYYDKLRYNHTFYFYYDKLRYNHTFSATAVGNFVPGFHLSNIFTNQITSHC